jgi:hypothetical protein
LPKGGFNQSQNFNPVNMKKIIVNLSINTLTACSILILSGCNQSTPPASQAKSSNDTGHSHGPGGDHDHAQPSGSPHGGTPVQVGDHGFHLELVSDPIDGKMLAYVLDDHMEKYVKVPLTTFDLVAKSHGQEQRLTFNPVTNAPAGTATNTSLFSASAPGLAGLTNFDGTIPKITLDGETFENVTFSYPKGSRHSH